jgi:hypothetical protein
MKTNSCFQPGTVCITAEKTSIHPVWATLIKERT